MGSSELLPSAVYSAPDVTKNFKVDPSKPHSVNGKTTGPSDYLIQVTDGTYNDKDKPSENKDTRIGRLRTYITDLNDQVNVFLTERLEKEKLERKRQKKLEKAEKAKGSKEK